MFASLQKIIFLLSDVLACLENYFLTIECVHFALKTVFFFQMRSLLFQKFFTVVFCFENFFLTFEPLLSFENNYLFMECVRYASKNNFLTIGRAGFASKIISLLSNVFALL